MKDFNGKTAVVTGAASGIGKALSMAFASRGANVVMADVEAASLEAARSEVAAAGAEAIGVPTDVTKEDQVEALAETAWERFGAVHVVCNNAGVLIRGNMLDADRKDWDWILGVNLWGVINGVRAFVPRMRDSGEEGHIVNTASEAGHFAGDGYGVYNTSKFAVVGLTESLVRDLRRSASPCCARGKSKQEFLPIRTVPRNSNGKGSPPMLIAALPKTSWNLPTWRRRLLPGLGTARSTSLVMRMKAAC
jgi:NAD(P)-dependent dehydrogenase (short-subunit alcohol dehydrogenase family)